MVLTTVGDRSGDERGSSFPGCGGGGLKLRTFGGTRRSGGGGDERVTAGPVGMGTRRRCGRRDKGVILTRIGRGRRCFETL